MTTLFHTLDNHLSLKIVSETRVYMDGHPILSYNYNIYLDNKKPVENTGQGDNKKPDKYADPDFLGVITFEKPGHIFTYTAGDGRTLDPAEVEEVIEYLSHIRDNPSLWRITEDI